MQEVEDIAKNLYEAAAKIRGVAVKDWDKLPFSPKAVERIHAGTKIFWLRLAEAAIKSVGLPEWHCPICKEQFTASCAQHNKKEPPCDVAVVPPFFGKGLSDWGR